MDNNILDQIVNSSVDNPISGNNKRDSIGSISQSDDNDGISTASIMDLEDASAFRLDTPNSAAPNLKPKKLFYTEDDDDDALDPEKNIGITQRPKKKVRFNSIKRNDPSSDKETALYPWELKKVIRKEFREKLPNNYEIKRWKKPSRIMVNSVIHLLEANVQTSIETVFERYRSEVLNVTHQNGQEVDKIYRQKQSIMNDIVAKIKVQLKKSRFPARISERDLDVEYIVSKRNFIQKRYAEELDNAERVETELFKEQALLEEAKNSCSQARESNKIKLTNELIKKNLHPSLNDAIDNAYGLIKASKTSTAPGDGFQRDSKELNLKISQVKQPSDDLHDKILSYLPALEQLNEVTEKLEDSISVFTSGEQEVLQDTFLDEQ